VSSAKVRKTVTLDSALVEALGDDDAGLSSTINAILRDEVERRQTLSDPLARLETERGPVDEERVAEFRQRLR
jgi:hypothetical protein